MRIFYRENETYIPVNGYATKSNGQYMLKIILISSLVLLLLGLGYFFYLGIRSHTVPGNLGLRDGKFIPCPESPNCVSTQAPESDKEHYMAPIPYNGDRSEAMATLKAVVNEMPRTEILLSEEEYLHAAFTSFIFRFTDDVEFYLPLELPEIRFRSASRIGYSDLGANRKRMQQIRKLFQDRNGGN